MDRPNGERERPAASAPSDDTILATAAAKTGKRAWDVSALLGEEQRAAVAELAELLLHRPLARPEWNTSHMDGVGDEAPDGDDSAGGAEEASIAALYRKLGEEQEATEDLGDDDLTDVHEHHARMTGIVQLCDDILKLLAVVEDTLVRLQTQHDSVVDKTSALHAECETLLADKLELEALASRIEGHLSVYDQLEGMQRQLAAPDFGVTSQAFMPLLVQADEAIAHLSKSAQFADSSAYLSRFRQVQARLLALVQAHVTGLLQSMTDKILLNTKAAAPTAGRTGGNGDKAAVTSGAGASDESGSGETGRGAAIEMSMAYVQFQSVGDAVKETLGKMADRVLVGKEYAAVLHECRDAYFKQRRALLLDPVRDRIQTAASQGQNDLGAIARQGCALLCDVCHREYKLQQRFFPPRALAEYEGLDTLMAPLCDALVDALRPLYLKVVNVADLCALAAILKGEVLEEQVELRGASLGAMKACVGQLLHEVQERLTFRAQIMIRDEIQAYTPSNEDLDYPNKLIALAHGAPSRPHSVAGLGGAVGGGEIWLVVLPRTLACLSQIFRTVDKKIFEGLAQDSVLACTQALLTATALIEKKQGNIEGSLFLVMHLLKLREQIVPFDIDFSATDINLDFRDTRAALSRLVSTRAGIFSWSADNALLGLARAPPRAYRTQQNSKKVLERELKRACEALIQLIASQVADPIVSWVRKADALAHGGGGAGGGGLRAHAFAAPHKIKELMQGLRGSVTEFTGGTLPKMQLYLPNQQTRNVLVTPIKANILEAYGRLHMYLLADFQPDEYVAMGAISPDELSQMLNHAPKVEAGLGRSAAGGSGGVNEAPTPPSPAVRSQPVELELGGGSGGARVLTAAAAAVGAAQQVAAGEHVAAGVSARIIDATAELAVTESHDSIRPAKAADQAMKEEEEEARMAKENEEEVKAAARKGAKLEADAKAQEVRGEEQERAAVAQANQADKESERVAADRAEDMNKQTALQSDGARSTAAGAAATLAQTLAEEAHKAEAAATEAEATAEQKKAAAAAAAAGSGGWFFGGRGKAEEEAATAAVAAAQAQRIMANEAKLRADKAAQDAQQMAAAAEAAAEVAAEAAQRHVESNPAPQVAGGEAVGGGQLPPGFIFENGELKYVGT